MLLDGRCRRRGFYPSAESLPRRTRERRPAAGKGPCRSRGSRAADPPRTFAGSTCCPSDGCGCDSVRGRRGCAVGRSGPKLRAFRAAWDSTSDSVPTHQPKEAASAPKVPGDGSRDVGEEGVSGIERCLHPSLDRSVPARRCDLPTSGEIPWAGESLLPRCSRLGATVERPVPALGRISARRRDLVPGVADLVGIAGGVLSREDRIR